MNYRIAPSRRNNTFLKKLFLLYVILLKPCTMNKLNLKNFKFDSNMRNKLRKIPVNKNVFV